MRELQRRHLRHAKLSCSEQAPVAGDYTPLAVDQDRVGEAKLAYGRSDLSDLRRAVGARIAGVGNQLCHGGCLVGREARCRHAARHLPKSLVTEGPTAWRLTSLRMISHQVH